MDDVKLALLGDREAQKRITTRWDLLPCPFCGGKAYLFVDDGVRVICPKCEASTKIRCDCIICDKVTGNAVRSVIESWNTRAPILSEDEMEGVTHD